MLCRPNMQAQKEKAIKSLLQNTPFRVDTRCIMCGSQVVILQIYRCIKVAWTPSFRNHVLDFLSFFPEQKSSTGVSTVTRVFDRRDGVVTRHSFNGMSCNYLIAYLLICNYFTCFNPNSTLFFFAKLCLLEPLFIIIFQCTSFCDLFPFQFLHDSLRQH